MPRNKPKRKFIPVLLCDFYKLAHRTLFPDKTEKVYSVLLSRTNKYLPTADKTIALGFQSFTLKYLIDYFEENFFDLPEEEVVADYEFTVKHTLGEDYADSKHIRALHKLGYLPVKISSLEEGSAVPVQTPLMTIENTHKDFYWIPNFLETLLSCELWQMMTSASIARSYRKLLEDYALETVGNTDAVDFQAHDFSMRGMSSVETAKLSGFGHLTFFKGTDTVPAIGYAVEYYNADLRKELVGTSIPATEHSVMCANTPIDGESLDEYEAFRRIIQDKFKRGFVSIVSDSYDFWKVIDETLPRLKSIIMERDGKVVIRPDSGNPVDILCGIPIIDLDKNDDIESLEDAKEYMEEFLDDEMRESTPHGEYGDKSSDATFKFEDKYYHIRVSFEWNRYDKRYYYIDGVSTESCDEYTPSVEELGLIESLWNIFGGHVNDLGYKELDSHIGAIYGDSITHARAKEILSRLKEKGFASTNIVFGVGSYTYQYNTRDSLGFAMKATYNVCDGKERLLFKDPKTDSGKRSPRGMLHVYRDEYGNYITTDGLFEDTLAALNEQHPNELKPLFQDGKLLRETSLEEIRERAKLTL